MRLLMLELDSHLISAVARSLEQERAELVAVASVAAAREQTKREHFDVAMLDCNLIHDEELSAFAALPLILTSSFLEPAGRHRFFGQGTLLRKPFTSTQLLSALHAACGAPSLDAPRLVDVLRRAHSRAETAAFQVGNALVFLERGELVHAEMGDARGVPALAAILAQPEQRVVRLPVRPLLRTIHQSFQPLILDLLRRLEEREQAAGGVVRIEAARAGNKEPCS